MNKRIIKRSKGVSRAQIEMFPQDSPGTSMRLMIGKPGGEYKKVLPPAILPF